MKKILLTGICTLTLLLLSFSCASAATEKTLTLREDWHITEDWDLNIPSDTTLIIEGNGYYIYEMGGRLINTGEGRVEFRDTALYPLSDDKESKKTYKTDIWNEDESARLVLERSGVHSAKLPIAADGYTKYEYSVTKAEGGYSCKFSMKASKEVKGTFIIALYGGENRLVGLSAFYMNDYDTAFTIPETVIKTADTATTYKIMFWDEMGNIKPICNAEGNSIAE